VLSSGLCVTSGLDKWTDQMVEVLVGPPSTSNEGTICAPCLNSCLCSCVNHAYKWEGVLKSKLGQELKRCFESCWSFILDLTDHAPRKMPFLCGSPVVVGGEHKLVEKL
jgi:hypothetical protein